MPARHRRSRGYPGSRTAVSAVATLAVATGLLSAPTAFGTPPAEAAAASAAASASSDPPADTAEDGPRVVSETWLDDRTVDLRVDSPAVGQVVPVRILLPAGWAARPDRRWPVLHLLHGAHDDYTSWTRETDIEEFTADKDMITVMPSAGPTGFPTAWWNFGRNDTDYETFQVEEVDQLLRRDYRASDVRAVGGVSTGGYGAMAFAARRPGTFAAAASYSGILHTTHPGVPVLVQAIVAREGLLSWLLWGHPWLQRSLWDDRNPYQRAAALRGTSLYISAGSGVAGGDGDVEGEILESALWPSTRSFTRRLESLGVPATVHLYSGGSHGWQFWQREFRSSWPMLTESLGLPE